MIYDEDSHKYNESIINVPDIRFAKSIALLCKAHRDYYYRDENGEKVIVYTIIDTPKTEAYPEGEVHTQFLACIVRIADELDITNQRAPHDVYIHLKNFINELSQSEWLKHDLFNMVKIDNECYTIKLIPNIDFIKQRDKELQDRRIIRKLLFSKAKKVSLELANLKDIMEDETNKPFRIGYKGVDVDYDKHIVTKDDFEIYQSDVDKARKEASLDSPLIELKAQFIDSDKITLAKEDYLNKYLNEINKEIELFHKHEELISLGNFILPSGFYSRFYLNTNNFLPQNRILNLITDIYYEIYKEKQIDCVLGIDKAGLIIAPNLSLKLQCNYTYLIHKNDEKESVTFEKGCSIKGAKKILVLTDVISSGLTIENAEKEIQNRFSPDELYFCSIFCTNNKVIEELQKRFHIYCINNKYQFMIYAESEINSSEELRNEFHLLKSIKK